MQILRRKYKKLSKGVKRKFENFLRHDTVWFLIQRRAKLVYNIIFFLLWLSIVQITIQPTFMRGDTLHYPIENSPKSTHERQWRHTFVYKQRVLFMKVRGWSYKAGWFTSRAVPKITRCFSTQPGSLPRILI